MGKAVKRRKPIDPKIAKRIRLLRGERHEKQKEFAELLGVSQTTVSAWEKGKSYPLPESWLNLGRLARDEDSAWFYTRGGEALEKMVLAATRYSRARRRPAKEGELIRIAPLQLGDAQTGEILLPAERVPNPDSTYYIVLESPTCGDALVRSDIVVIDRVDSQKDPKSLAPFWGRLIVVKFTPLPSSWPTGFSYYWKQGFSVGRPVMRGMIESGKYLGAVEFFPSTGVTGPGELSLGHWEEPLPVSSMEKDERSVGERALKEFRLPEALELIGEVICVLLGPESIFSIPEARTSRG